MPVYGSFETVREVSRSGRGAVYTARRVGTSDERFAVKIFELPAYLAEEGEVERESAFFLHAAEVQKAVGRPGSAWATVYESGALEGGAWYATDLFDRSIERLLLNRPDLEPADLLRVVDSVLSGLYELRDAAGRAHGNLKTSNVLLSGKGDLSAARVVLCDPWATERLRGGEAREDLRGLGDLIHWLVLHRGVRRPTGWPVQTSPEWKRLGRVGDGWLTLTNKLLDPTDEKLTLEEVPALVPGGKVRPGSSTTVLPTPTARVGRESKHESKPESKHESKPEVRPVPPKSEPPKVEALKVESPKSEPAKAEPPKAEPPKPEPPKPEVKPEHKVESKPEAIRPAPGAAGPATPPSATTPSTPAAPAPAEIDADVTQDLPSHGSGVAVGSAVGAAGLREASGAGAPVAPAPTMSRAPSMTSVGRVSTASTAGAPKSFEELEAESRRRQAEPKKTSNAKWIGIGVGAVALVAVAAVVISNLGGGKESGGGSNNEGPQQATGNGADKKETNHSGDQPIQPSSPIAEKQKQIRDAASADDVINLVFGAKDSQQITGEALERIRALAPAPTAGDLRGLQSCAPGFRKLVEGANKFGDGEFKSGILGHARDAYTNWFAGLTYDSAGIDEAVKLNSSFGVADAQLPAVVKTAQRVREVKGATTVVGALKYASEPGVESGEGVKRAIELASPPKAGDLKDLQGKASEFELLLGAAGRSADAALRSRAQKHANDAYGQWFKGVGLADPNLEAAKGEAKKYGVGDAAMPDVAKVAGLLKTCEGHTDKGKGAQRVEEVRAEIGKNYPSLAVAAKPRLDELAERYKTAVVEKPPPKDPDPPPVNPNTEKIAAAKGVIQKIAGHLTLGLDFKDLAPDGGDSIEELLKQVDGSVEKDAVAGDTALTDALARARGLGAIASIADAPAAAKRSADEAGRGRASEALAAGSRAMSLFKDPAAGDLDALEAGGKFLEGVRDSVGKLPNGVAAKRDALVKAANDRRRAMFMASVGKVAAGDEAVVRRVAGMAAGFGVKPEELPVKVRLNLLALTLRDELAKAGDDAAATAAVGRFKAAAGALGAEVAPLVAPMIAGLDTAAKAPEAPAGPVLDFAKVGPMSVGGGWSLDAAHPAAGDSNVTYKSPSGQSVQFIRLANGAYLSATEVTVGVFNDAVKTQPALLDQAFLVKKEQLKGAFAWDRAGRDIAASKGGAGEGADPFGWLATHIALQNAGIAPYPAGLEGAIGQPSARHPMQQVASQVASQAAAAIGCRLPTEAEWAQALSMAGPGERANVRDASWKKFNDYLKDVAEGRVPPKAGKPAPPRDQLPWPDQSIFSLQQVIPNKWNAEPVVSEDDGAVWFRPVPEPDGKFHDLVGNVAEWLKAPESASARDRFLIGGSALSPKEIEPTAVQRRQIPNAVTYADVGFRLAFDAAGGTAPAPEPLIARLKKAADAIVLAK